jgi:hypothetical protein
MAEARTSAGMMLDDKNQDLAGTLAHLPELSRPAMKYMSVKR